MGAPVTGTIVAGDDVLVFDAVVDGVVGGFDGMQSPQ